MAEAWFCVLTRGLLRRGEFTSRADLAGKVTDFTIRYNRTAHPWTWRYDARIDHARYQARHDSDEHQPQPKPTSTPHLQQRHNPPARNPSRTYAALH